MSTGYRKLGRRNWAAPDGAYTIRSVAPHEYLAHAVGEIGIVSLGKFASVEDAIVACEADRAEGKTRRALVRRIKDPAELEQRLPGVLALARAVRGRFGDGVKLKAHRNEHENGDGV